MEGSMAEYFFWVSLSFTFYGYCGYPLVLVLWRWLAPWPVEKAASEPEVTVVMAAYNEKGNIREKIRNCLSLDYPRDRLQIIVSLDAPTDGTEVLALAFASQGVQLGFAPSHRGKAAAINSAVSRARGAILVFVDARQTLDPKVIRELTANFSDPSVGAVSGELLLMDDNNRESTSGVGLYWRYEKFIRMAESSIHSVVGVTGALYAIRRELFQNLPEDTILDDVALPMNVVLAGRRVVMDTAARAFDRVASKPAAEFGRKVRTLTGNFQLLARMPQLLNPRRNPVFFQFVSHKVVRLFIPYALIVLLVSNLFLLRGVYLVFFVLQSLWYCLALAGCFSNSRWLKHIGQHPAKREIEGRI